MRQMMRQAVEGVRDTMGEVAGAFRGGGLTDSEIVTRYLNEHRGNIPALLEFARQNAPEGGNVMQEALRYEREMERRIEARGG